MLPANRNNGYRFTSLTVPSISYAPELDHTAAVEMLMKDIENVGPLAIEDQHLIPPLFKALFENAYTGTLAAGHGIIAAFVGESSQSASR